MSKPNIGNRGMSSTVSALPTAPTGYQPSKNSLNVQRAQTTNPGKRQLFDNATGRLGAKNVHNIPARTPDSYVTTKDKPKNNVRTS